MEQVETKVDVLAVVSESRIQQAIAECDRYIKREEPRAAHLRPVSSQQYLDYCIAHKAKLQAALDARKSVAQP